MSKTEDKTVKLSDTMPEAGSSFGTSDVAAKAVAGANHDAELSGKKMRVTFFCQDAEGGKDPIFASLNFYAYQIPRDIAVDIPAELLEVFEVANARVLSTTTTGGVTEKNIKRFSYTVHGAVQPVKKAA